MAGQKTGVATQIKIRENEVREDTPVPHDNRFQSILSFSQLFLI